MKKFTIAYIEHNQEVFSRLLEPSIKNLEGEFDVISVSDEKYPAENYNTLKSMCKTPYLILTHQDVTFSPNFLKNLEDTIDALDNDFGALGMVGVDGNRQYHWSKEGILVELYTADCCFLVIKSDCDLLFDEIQFGEYHLYVEDYCAQLRDEGKKIYTISSNSKAEDIHINYEDIKNETFLNHHSATCSSRGYCWGRYWEFRNKLEAKWPGIKTT